MEGAWGSHPLPGKSFLNYFEAAVLGVDHGDGSPRLVNQPPPDLNPPPPKIAGLIKGLLTIGFP